MGARRRSNSGLIRNNSVFRNDDEAVTHVENLSTKINAFFKVANDDVASNPRVGIDDCVRNRGMITNANIRDALSCILSLQTVQAFRKSLLP